MSKSGRSPIYASEMDALKRQQAYEWMGAAQLYQQQLDSPGPHTDIRDQARIRELQAKCYFRGAFQARDRQEFKERMILANRSYKELVAIHEAQDSPGLSKLAKARELYTTFWLSDTYSDKSDAIRQSIGKAEEALLALREKGDRIAIMEAEKDLLIWLLEAALGFVQEWEETERYFGQAMKIGPEVITGFTSLGESEDLLESLWNFSIMRHYVGTSVLGLTRRNELNEELKRLQVQINDLAEKLETPRARFLSKHLASYTSVVEGDHPKALKLAEDLVSIAQGTKDIRFIGLACVHFLIVLRFSQMVEEDLERKREIFRRGIEAAPVGMRALEVVLDWWWLGWLHDEYAECYTWLALAEVEVERKKAHLLKSIEVANRGMIYDSPSNTIGHALSKAMFFLAAIETNPLEKLRLLRDALAIRQNVVRTIDRIDPHSEQPGVHRNYLALIKAELSDLEADPTERVHLLKDAISDMEKCIEIYGKYARTRVSIATLARYEEWYGDIVLRLLRLTAQSNVARRALQVYQDAITNLTRADLLSHVASLHWKVAMIHDTLGNYREASDAFDRAAEHFRSASKKFPGSAFIFGELASYMEAWSLIEAARLHHNDEQYLSAAEDYAKVAINLERTKAWDYLSQHYTACSGIEEGEALSRQERLDSSIKSFRAALRAFQAAKLSSDRRLSTATDLNEKADIERWLEITSGRTRYCEGRIELEEAKILDRKGDEEASSGKYHSASEIFKALAGRAESDQGRQEVNALALFCDAWAKMKEAEGEASPELYSQAAELFGNAKDAVTRKKTRVLAMANASICKALEHGSQFRLTRETGLYSEIKRHLETATDYYEQAGLENAAAWTRATGKLFDALVCLADATKERDSRKRTEFYNLAEKHLQMAAKLYGDAGFQGKKEEAQRHLNRAKEEKELLLSPVEALAESPTFSGSSVTPVALLRDQALGLERFESANVVGNTTLTQSEVGAGSDAILELELVNVGKTPATLVKLENIVPEGLGVNREKVAHRLEDNFLDMKGKTLEYLKTHEVKVPIRTTRKGTFDLRPRILYVDEKGNYRSYEFQPISLVVKELGLSGWVKGPK